MLSVLIWVKGEAETLNELVEDALRVRDAVLLVGLVDLLHALHEINYCSFVDVEEKLGDPVLNFWVGNAVLLENLFDEELLHLVSLFLARWILRWWSIIRRRLMPFLIEEHVLLAVTSMRHVLERFKMPLPHFFSHFIFADAAPVLGLAGLHSDGPLVALGASELHLHLAWTDHSHFEGTIVHFDSGPY